MPNVLIRGVSDKTLNAIKRRAALHGRSVQQELKLTLDRIGEDDAFDYLEYVRRMRAKIASYAPHQTDSTDMVREDRER